MLKSITRQWRSHPLTSPEIKIITSQQQGPSFGASHIVPFDPEAQNSCCKIFDVSAMRQAKVAGELTYSRMVDENFQD